MTLQVGIFIFDDVEVLDFAGPYEVFTTATRVQKRLTPEREPCFQTCTIAASLGTVRARAGLRVLPEFEFSQHPALDLLIIPGGVVTAEMAKPEVIAWISRAAAHAQLRASVCTGAFLLAQAGVLQGHKVTTHWEDVEDLHQQFPNLDVTTGVRWVDHGDLVTSAGISAGIDMSLHLVERMAGRALAELTARQLEFDWQENPPG